MSERLWVDIRHPLYENERQKRQFARDQYTGDALHVSMDEANRGVAEYNSTRLNVENVPNAVRLFDTLKVGTLGTYLRKRAQGESAGAFRERSSITRFPGHMAALVDSQIGGIFAVESKAVRTWGAPLGDPQAEGTVMFDLWRDIDGSGMDWPSWLVSSASDLIVDNVVYYLADPSPDGNGPTRIHAIDPDRVLNWREEGGRVVEALVREDRWESDSLFSEPELVTYFTRYTVSGWERYRLVEDEKGKRDVVLMEANAWRFPFYTDKSKSRMRLPLGRVKLPLRRYVGYQMAQDHNMLYNLLSDARWLFRVINHPRLAGDVEDSQFQASMEKLAMGFNALQGKWSYISPSPENGAAAYKMYAEETRQFYITNHQRMNSSNIERSATEVVYNEAAGRTSFLTLLVGAVDEIENDALFLASQIEAPSKPDSWTSSRVVRSRDFKPVDIEHLAQTQSTSLAALLNYLPADLAASVAKDGLTPDNMMKMVPGVMQTDMPVDDEAF